MTSVLALDPGKTTGWAFWDEIAGFQCGQVETRWDFYIWLTHQSPDKIVMEKYTITAGTLKMSTQYDALYIIGFVEGLCETDSNLPASYLTLQTPSQAKGFLSNDQLKDLGWYRRGLPHAMDAARHLGLYLVNTNHDARPSIMSILLKSDA